MSTTDGSINSKSSSGHGHKFILHSRILKKREFYCLLQYNRIHYCLPITEMFPTSQVDLLLFFWRGLERLKKPSSIIYTELKVSLCPLSFRRVQRITARAITFKSSCHLREFALKFFLIECKISCEVNILLPAQLCRM